jgi:6,7-dimethyl-8-ribityllumazine synthase
VLIVCAPYYVDIVAQLRRGAEAALAAAGAKVAYVEVPGALEIPAAIALVDASRAAGQPAFDGFVALGCVIRGETFHFELVCGESARGLTDLGVRQGLAIGNGILTVDTLAQAEERADPAGQDKGGDAARAAISLIALRRALASGVVHA